MEDEAQGAAFPEADPAVLLMDQSSKLEDYKLAPWHMPPRRVEEFLNFEDKVQGAAIPTADPAALSTDQRHIIHPPPMIESRLSIVHYPILKPPPSNSKMASRS